jgi:L-2,4-diaminobutyric acid acetyltransferase
MSRGDAEAITLRAPTPADGAAVWELVKGTGVLDLNSLYAYVLHFDHHAATSVVAERGGRIVGFITGYVVPTRPEVLFVWQVGVDAAARGQGLAGRMLRELLRRPSAARVRLLETTVTPSNTPSRRLFRGLARRLGAAC